jgi:type II secretory pathway component PulC
MPPLPPSAPGTEVTVAPSVPSQSDDLLEGQNDPSVLQRFPLDNFSLSAIVVANNPDNNIAMLEYGGVGYTVRKGSRVQGGVVKEITPTSIIIEVSNTAGNTYGSNTYEISLPD